MRNTARDIRPGCLALVQQLAGNVLEGNHMTIALAHQLDGERHQLPAARVAHDPAIKAGLHHGRDLRRHFVEGCGMMCPLPAFKKGRLCWRIHQQHTALTIDGNDARADRFQDCLDKASALLEFAIGRYESVGLFLDLRRHAIERPVEQADFVGPGSPFDAKGEIACADLASRNHQIGQRFDLPVGKP